MKIDGLVDWFLIIDFYRLVMLGKVDEQNDPTYQLTVLYRTGCFED